MLPSIQLPHVLPDRGPSDAGVTLCPHVVPKGHNDLLYLLGQLPGGGQDQGLGLHQSCVYHLKDRNRECCSLACARLSLPDLLYLLGQLP